jgi:hypothetical protein
MNIEKLPESIKKEAENSTSFFQGMNSLYIAAILLIQTVYQLIQPVEINKLLPSFTI